MPNDILDPVVFGDLVQIRRGTAASWTAANPVLADGELGFASDTGELKIGDGVSAWADIAAGSTQSDLTTAISDAIAALNLGDIVTHDVAEFEAAVTPESNIAAVTGGPSVTDQDDEARAAIDDILALLVAQGLMDAP
jgi:hypothetical protein